MESMQHLFLVMLVQKMQVDGRIKVLQQYMLMVVMVGILVTVLMVQEEVAVVLDM